ncbi:CGNR zinc finger domain-containing protein [Saccharothrix violaceirubra]|uniref:Putative RNA-binding Zn ribbon-like protein n=1 Tax=Saccharothrix violaceirubra TaxID=413306 RepID=A0A7W7T6T4_9PSEU|nr:CGNR zinc finger domain-containing protein [Saccharothrix violaceirubra]MBB4967642.1 putative RNA-binding Zn ribbon-like protein [Saccharothrix violaceirubra]
MDVLAFVGTVRFDGQNGFLDDLDTPEGFAAWSGSAPDEDLRQRVVRLRWATRSLLAHLVDAPDRADTPLLLAPDVATAVLNDAAARVPRYARLEWATRPAMRYVDAADPADRFVAGLATAAIEFLTGGERERVRACPAPRCVRFFVKAHPQQQWCAPACGNRARVSRHYHRVHAG